MRDGSSKQIDVNEFIDSKTWLPQKNTDIPFKKWLEDIFINPKEDNLDFPIHGPNALRITDLCLSHFLGIKSVAVKSVPEKKDILELIKDDTFLFELNDILKWKSFVNMLNDPRQDIEQHIVSKLNSIAKIDISKIDMSIINEEIKLQIIDAINQMLSDENLYNEELYEKDRNQYQELNYEAIRLKDKIGLNNLCRRDMMKFNKLFLLSIWPEDRIRKSKEKTYMKMNKIFKKAIEVLELTTVKEKQKFRNSLLLVSLYHDIGKAISRSLHPQLGANIINNLDRDERNKLVKEIGYEKFKLIALAVEHHDKFGNLSTGEASLTILSSVLFYKRFEDENDSDEDEKKIEEKNEKLKIKYSNQIITTIMLLNMLDMASISPLSSKKDRDEVNENFKKLYGITDLDSSDEALGMLKYNKEILRKTDNFLGISYENLVDYHKDWLVLLKKIDQVKGVRKKLSNILIDTEQYPERTISRIRRLLRASAKQAGAYKLLKYYTNSFIEEILVGILGSDFIRFCDEFAHVGKLGYSLKFFIGLTKGMVRKKIGEKIECLSVKKRLGDPELTIGEVKDFDQVKSFTTIIRYIKNYVIQNRNSITDLFEEAIATGREKTYTGQENVKLNNILNSDINNLDSLKKNEIIKFINTLIEYGVEQPFIAIKRDKELIYKTREDIEKKCRDAIINETDELEQLDEIGMEELATELVSKTILILKKLIDKYSDLLNTDKKYKKRIGFEMLCLTSNDAVFKKIIQLICEGSNDYVGFNMITDLTTIWSFD